MTEERLTFMIGEVAEMLGISRNSAYKLASEQMLPVPVIRLGRRLVVAKEPFLRALGASEEFVEQSGDDD